MIDVKVPELAESIAEASIETWQVAVGDAVKTGQVLVTIETDKVTLEVPAQQDGVLVEIFKQDGADVSSTEVLACIDTEATVATVSASAPAAQSEAVAAPVTADIDVITTPAARKIAAETGVDVTTVHGSGRGGRVTKGDVQAAATQGPPVAIPAPASKPVASAPVPTIAPMVAGERRERMSKLRAKVAERLLQSQQQTAMLSTFNEVDMSAIIALRKRYRDEFEQRNGIKLGIMSFFVNAVTAALQQYPIINSRIEGGEIVYHDYCDVGIAVGSPRGLVVPILRDAQVMNSAAIERHISDFGQRAQSGKLELDELIGGTFTITNGGVFGSMLSTPIINPPQSAILGVHATKERPVVIDSEILVRPMNYLALSYDHRLIDGRDAVLFLVAVKQGLEDPARLALGL